uniref:Uncharacterized protein n=1 Tax=Anguilla anguilla TaxID=7936 RepID=A0A0E9V171_ANGAN
MALEPAKAVKFQMIKTAHFTKFMCFCCNVVLNNYVAQQKKNPIIGKG